MHHYEQLMVQRPIKRTPVILSNLHWFKYVSNLLKLKDNKLIGVNHDLTESNGNYD